MVLVTTKNRPNHTILIFGISLVGVSNLIFTVLSVPYLPYFHKESYCGSNHIKYHRIQNFRRITSEGNKYYFWLLRAALARFYTRKFSKIVFPTFAQLKKLSKKFFFFFQKKWWPCLKDSIILAF